MNLLAPSRLAIVAAACLAAVAYPALAEDAPAASPPATTAPAADAAAAAPGPAEPTDRVVATVNGENITELDLAAAEPDLREILQQYPQDQQYAALVKGVVDIRLMARAAEAAGLDKDVQTAHVLEYARERTLRNTFLTDKLSAQITEAAVKARYDAEVAKFVPRDEIHAVHILVNTEDEAKAIIAQLDQGGDFAAIAKEKSTDKGSGAEGGDLGFFAKGQMVKPFEDAAFALNVGEYTKAPVKSDFGWHVIKVLEKRKTAPPTFEERQDALSRDMAREVILAEIDKLHTAAKIEIVPPPAPPPADGTTAPAPADGTAAPPPADGTTAPAPADGTTTPPPAQ